MLLRNVNYVPLEVEDDSGGLLSVPNKELIVDDYIDPEK